MISGILDVIPYTKYDRHQIVANLLTIMYNIFQSTQLNPPITVLPGMDSTMLKVGELIFSSPARCFKRHRFIMFLRLEEKAVSHRDIVVYIESEGFVVFRFCFTTAHKFRACQCCQCSIACTIGEVLCLYIVYFFSL